MLGLQVILSKTVYTYLSTEKPYKNLTLWLIIRNTTFSLTFWMHIFSIYRIVTLLGYFTDAYNGSAQHQINFGVFLSASNCIIVKGFKPERTLLNILLSCVLGGKKTACLHTFSSLCLKGVKNLKTFYVLMCFATFLKVLGICSKHCPGNLANCLPLAWMEVPLTSTHHFEHLFAP